MPQRDFKLVDGFKVEGDVNLHCVKWGWGDLGKFLRGNRVWDTPKEASLTFFCAYRLVPE